MTRLLAACLALAVGLAQANEGPTIAFSGEELAYIAQHPVITMCVDPDWEPFERIDDKGHHVGIAADLLKLVGERSSLRFELRPTSTWEASLAASKAGECQILSFLNRTPDRERWLDFTAPIFTDPNILVARNGHAYVPDIRNLRGESVALPRGTMVEEWLRRDYPNLRIILTDSEPEAMRLVAEGQADLTVRSLIVAAYAIRKEGLFNLKIAGQIPELGNELRLGVRREEKLLRDILDKGVLAVTREEREAASNRHVAITVQRGFDYTLLWQLLAGALCLAAIGGWWVQKLRRLNRELERLSITDRLTGIYNRIKLDETLATEISRTSRYGHPFSVILIDIDHFKRINDNHGHPAGDRILIDIAALLREGSRETDIVGRWGGEEFMVICPHTDTTGACQLAEKLRQAIAARNFQGLPPQSASFGCASSRPDDQANDLVGRADRALYSAKHAGRNRVVGGDA